MKDHFKEFAIEQGIPFALVIAGFYFLIWLVSQ